MSYRHPILISARYSHAALSGIMPICAICGNEAPHAVAREGLDAICARCVKPVKVTRPFSLRQHDEALRQRSFGRQLRTTAKTLEDKIHAEHLMQQAEIRLAGFEVRGEVTPLVSKANFGADIWRIMGENAAVTKHRKNGTLPKRERVEVDPAKELPL